MDTNRIITIEELKVGDEILVPSNSHLRYYRVLREPKKNSKTNKWSGVQCSTYAEENRVVHNAGTKYKRVRIYTIYHCTPEDHNIKKMIYGLQWRSIWLVKREENI